MSPEMRELISANREKVEDVFKAVFESREVLTTMLDERMARLVCSKNGFRI